MASFKADGIEWKIELTVGMLGKIKRDVGLSLANSAIDPEKFVEVISTHPEKLVETLWVVCEKQATAAEKTPEQFGELFDGETLDQAVKALLNGTIDFFPKARGRDAIRRGMPKAWTKIEKDVNAEIDKKLDSMFSNTAGSSPESSE